MIINITNGEEFNDYIKNQAEGVFVPFNEALIDGHPSYPLFDESFIKERCLTHHVNKKSYIEIMSSFLNAISFLKEDDVLVLWFGKDMFCQINLLGLLSYLESLEIRNKIYVTVIDDNTKEVLHKEIPITLKGFIASYLYLFENKQYLKTNLELMNLGIKSYLHLFYEENEIVDFINENKSLLDRRSLLIEVFKKTREYGLGDVQVINLIKRTTGK